MVEFASEKEVGDAFHAAAFQSGSTLTGTIAGEVDQFLVVRGPDGVAQKDIPKVTVPLLFFPTYRLSGVDDRSPTPKGTNTKTELKKDETGQEVPTKKEDGPGSLADPDWEKVADVFHLLRGPVAVTGEFATSYDAESALGDIGKASELVAYAELEGLVQTVAKYPVFNKAKRLVLTYGEGAPLDKTKAILGKEHATEDDSFGFRERGSATKQPLTWHTYGWLRLGVVEGWVRQVKIDTRVVSARVQP